MIRPVSYTHLGPKPNWLLLLTETPLIFGITLTSGTELTSVEIVLETLFGVLTTGCTPLKGLLILPIPDVYKRQTLLTIIPCSVGYLSYSISSNSLTKFLSQPLG